MESNPIKTAIDLDSNQPLKVYQQLGNKLLRDQEFEEAELVFEKLLETYPEKPQGYQGLARVAMATEQFELAQQRWKKVLELFPDNFAAQVGLGNILIKRREFEQAEEVFQNISEKYPEKPQAYQGLASIAMEAQNFELAQQRLEQVLELFPDNLIAKVSLGNTLIKQVEFEKAETVFKNISERYPEKPHGYQGLARVANYSHSWELAVKRWDELINLFPDNYRYTIQKIDALQRLSLWKKATQTLQKAKSLFPEEIELDLARAKLQQNQYNYQAAQTILEDAALKKPENLKILLELANNYWHLGNYKDAQKILNEVKPKLVLDNSYVFKKFTELYVSILLYNNQIYQLECFLSETSIAEVFEKNLILNICQFFICRGKYQKASEFINKILQKKFTAESLYQVQKLLIFEKEKINNLQELEKWNFNPELNTVHRKRCYSLLEKIKLHENKYPEFSNNYGNLIEILYRIDKLSQKYNDVFILTEISPLESYGVALKIINYIKKRIPLSLIRLGDGEGNFLEYKPQWQDFREKDREIIQKLWWNSVKIDGDEWLKVRDQYISAIQNADILGIPDYYRICRVFQPINKFQTRDYRGLIAIIDNLLDPQFSQGESHFPESGTTLTSCHIHTHFEAWGFWQLILAQVKDCSVISCHEKVSQVLQKRYGITVNSFYRIPSEYKYYQLFNYQDIDDKNHYPNYFQQICSNIHVSYPGEVFLVAAGLLGKIYCQIIKQRGGIALDIGSVVDYWLNYNTRAWNNFPNSTNYTEIFKEILARDLQKR